MFSDFVRNFTITCPECKTSVTFSIDMDNTHALDSAVHDFKCPRCANELSYEAQNMISAIRAYNDALSELQNAAEQNHVKLS